MDQNNSPETSSRLLNERVTFDLNSSQNMEADEIVPSSSIEVSNEAGYDPEINMTLKPSQDWEADVSQLIPTHSWLSLYGLKKNRLDMNHLLPQIGFKHADAYDSSIKKPVCSRYGDRLFDKYFSVDGRSYNISASKDKLRQLEARITQAIALYRRRLEWLTTESRRIFGVIEERSIAVVVDIRNCSPHQFDQFRASLQRVIKEQIGQLSRFNIIRATDDLESFSEQSVSVSRDTVDSAIDWLWSLDRESEAGSTSAVEAVSKALSDKQLDCLYIFSEGCSTDGARELLRDKLTGANIPVHIVSYNCSNSGTIEFLKELTKRVGGRFHAYAVVMEMDSYEGQPISSGSAHASVVVKKRMYGGVPAGAGARPDVLELFEEIEQARNNLQQIQSLLEDLPAKEEDLGSNVVVPIKSELSKWNMRNAVPPGVDNEPTRTEPRSLSSQTYMSSKEWLKQCGLKAQHLTFYDVLGGVAFKHTDGVIDLKSAPACDVIQTDAVTRQKLVNAKYCGRFPHVRWRNGEVVHVQVTPEVHRNYEQKMRLVLENIQQRVDWLQQGSRELFGTVIEEKMYFLIDTSASMAPHIEFVKDKLFILMQEQLRHKQKFNFVGFDSKVAPWKDRLVEVNEAHLQAAWKWIKSLSCRGSTNTLGALKEALTDPSTQALYLLTDGRPDQPAKSILSQVLMHPNVPIHTISFNCADRAANEFLCQLAKDTGGRFHYYHENGINAEGPDPWESEDIRLLKQELEVGWRNLEKVALLRDECANIAWKQESRNTDRPSSAPSVSTPRSTASPRISSSRSLRLLPNKHRSWSPMSARTPRESSKMAYGSPLTAGGPCVAGHTKTSLLRTLTSSGGFDSGRDWLLPETRSLLEKQAMRQSLESESEKRRTLQRRQKDKRMTSKTWLAKNSLKAKKLTILDALSPTFIPHRPKFVSILGKPIYSKILPVAHQSEDNKEVHLVNPTAVNLKQYQENVEQQLQVYHRRLDRLVWRALPKTEKDEFSSEEPIRFMENKVKLWAALDRCGWPISERDVILLENEIRQGEGYIKQAEDLAEAARETNIKDDNKSIKSRSSSRSNSIHSTPRNEPVSDKATKPEKRTKKQKPNSKSRRFTLKGQRVIARNETDGYYYSGVVTRHTERKSCTVSFDDDRLGASSVPVRFLIPTGGAVAQPQIRIRDFVLCRAILQQTMRECLVPGIVENIPQRREARDKFYTVTLYTGQAAHLLRRCIHKISETRYNFIVDDIAEKREEKETATGRNDDNESVVTLSNTSEDEEYEKPRKSVAFKPSSDDESAQKLLQWKQTMEEQNRKIKKQKKKLKKLIQDLEVKREKMTLSKDQENKLIQHILAEINEKQNIAAKPSPSTSIEEWARTVTVPADLDLEVAEHVEHLRYSLPVLSLDNEILAKWSDDGWYYKSIIREDCGDCSYVVEDALGDFERIWREDILNEDDLGHALEVNDCVIAEHPLHHMSYAPGVVIALGETSATVRMFDRTEAKANIADVYKSSRLKFEADVSRIIDSEKQWVGQAVVALDKESGVFKLAIVQKRFTTGSECEVEWADGTSSILPFVYVFGALTRRRPLRTGDYVLALANQHEITYLPGKITSEKDGLFNVDFCDKSRSANLDQDLCYYLSEEFFKQTSEFYHHANDFY